MHDDDVKELDREHQSIVQRPDAGRQQQLRAHLRGLWSAVAGGWAEHAAYIDARSAPVTAAMLGLTAPRAGDRVLELACGPGGLGLAAAERVAPGGDVVLTDVVPEMTEIAAARAAALGARERRRARARPRGHRRAERRLRRRPVPRGAHVRPGSRARRARRSPACCARAAAPRSRCGPRASATPGSASCSTPSASRSARRSRRPASPGRSRSPTPSGLVRLLEAAGLADVTLERDPGAVARAARSTSGGRRTAALAGPLGQRLAALPDAAARAVRERARRQHRAVRDRRRARPSRVDSPRVRAASLVPRRLRDEVVRELLDVPVELRDARRATSPRRGPRARRSGRPRARRPPARPRG